VRGNTGASRSPVNAVRGPSSLATLTRRFASALEIRNNVDNAAAVDDSPNSSAGTSANDATTR
jgi:hypothetical protein